QGLNMNKLKYKAKLYPIGPIIALIMCIIVIIGQGFAYIKPEGIDWVGIIAAYVGIPIFIALYFGYKIKNKTRIIKLQDIDLSNED
ncbi:gamma-aminobutyrate permease, partial [Clostridium botulinum C str. Stockholm]